MTEKQKKSPSEQTHREPAAIAAIIPDNWLGSWHYGQGKHNNIVIPEYSEYFSSKNKALTPITREEWLAGIKANNAWLRTAMQAMKIAEPNPCSKSQGFDISELDKCDHKAVINVLLGMLLNPQFRDITSPTSIPYDLYGPIQKLTRDCIYLAEGDVSTPFDRNWFVEGVTRMIAGASSNYDADIWICATLAFKLRELVKDPELVSKIDGLAITCPMQLSSNLKNTMREYGRICTSFSRTGHFDVILFDSVINNLYATYASYHHNIREFVERSISQAIEVGALTSTNVFYEDFSSLFHHLYGANSRKDLFEETPW